MTYYFVCPSRKGLQEMLNIAKKYVKDKIFSFSTNPVLFKSKTKGIIFSPETLSLNGDSLPWVNHVSWE